MSTNDYPNQNALRDANNIYLDVMRGFIKHHLQKVKGKTVEDLIEEALLNNQIYEFDKMLEEHEDVKLAIDFNFIPRIINIHWRNIFEQNFNEKLIDQNRLWLIKEGRNKCEHRGSDLDPELTRTHLNIIAELLKNINRSDKQEAVEAIRDQLISDNMENQISEISEKLQAAEKDNSKNKKDLADANRQIEKLEKQQSEAKEEIEKLKNVEDEKKQSEKELSNLRKDFKETEEMWQLSEMSLTTTKNELKKVEKEMHILKERVTVTEQQFEEVTKQKEDYKKRLKASEESLSNTSKKFIALEEEKRVYIELIHAIENELAKVKNKNKDNNENISKTQNLLKTGDKSLYDALRQRRQNKKVSQSSRWSGDKSAREVVRDAVRELTQDKTDVEFAIKDVISVIHKTDSTFKKSTTGAQIIQDCVNHPSRRHHTSAKHNYYWRVETGKYRLFDPEKDKIEDLDDSIQT